jgi:hypothetical protein
MPGTDRLYRKPLVGQIHPKSTSLSLLPSPSGTHLPPQTAPGPSRFVMFPVCHVFSCIISISSMDFDRSEGRICLLSPVYCLIYKHLQNVLSPIFIFIACTTSYISHSSFHSCRLLCKHLITPYTLFGAPECCIKIGTQLGWDNFTSIFHPSSDAREVPCQARRDQIHPSNQSLR